MSVEKGKGSEWKFSNMHLRESALYSIGFFIIIRLVPFLVILFCLLGDPGGEFSGVLAEDFGLEAFCYCGDVFLSGMLTLLSTTGTYA